MDAEFIKVLQWRIAHTSVGPSTARGMGPKGTVAAARAYLAQVSLQQFHKPSHKDFSAHLNRVTTTYLNHLPQDSAHWGAARKFLNIYLRGVVYNRFLCEAYDLYHIEPWLEVPLDRQVAKGLRSEPGGTVLPRWRTVIRLDPKTSQIYQDFAAGVAQRMKINRVHLDVFYWNRETRESLR